MKPLLFSALAFLAAPLASATVTIDYVTVGDPGNAADTTGYGAVGYTYDIARNETTVSQYAEFLNAAAKSDPYMLYSTAMDYDSVFAGGIIRSGTNGSYTYSIVPGSENKPITYVSWFDAARFVNWLSNGQGSGSTETGVYNLNGAMSGIFTAKEGASISVPTEDEWYKAAYYDPTKNGGAGGYWLYPTRSDTLAGNTIGVTGAANYYDGDFVGYPGMALTNVGAYGKASTSYYGTNDQGGNVREWNASVIESIFGPDHGLSGGSWLNDGSYMSSSSQTYYDQTGEASNVGFRVVSVPEPAAWAMVLLSGALCASRRKR